MSTEDPLNLEFNAADPLGTRVTILVENFLKSSLELNRFLKRLWEYFRGHKGFVVYDLKLNDGRLAATEADFILC